MRVREDAFLPGRNSLFLLSAASYAYQLGCKNIAIGLLSDKFRLFPDQSKEFIEKAEKFLSFEMNYSLKILTPLMEFNKAEVITLARSKRLTKTYSCHSGGAIPCGKCIACLEIETALAKIGL
jgi:7-cyano-7-deazaguanine synthase